MPCRIPAGTWGVAKCSLYISSEGASSKDRQDKRFPPSKHRREGPPHTERAVLSGAAQQSKWAGKASRLSDKSVKKQQEEKKGKTRSS